MNQEELLRFMDFTKSAKRSSGAKLSGRCSPIFLTIYLSLQLLKTKFSVFMEGFHHQSILLMISEPCQEFKKCHKMELAQTYFGVILMIEWVGVCHQEELDTHLEKTLVPNLTETMD